MALSDNPIKVTDRRMFLPDGQLRDEFRHFEEGEARAPAAAPVPEPAPPPSVGAPPPPSVAAPPPPSAAAPPPPSAAAPPRDAAPPPASAADAFDTFQDPHTGGAPTIIDLIAMLAEPASVYLQQSQSAIGQRSESLELARLHIDLLGVLAQKTAGNLSPQEHSMLDDTLFQLRRAYVEISGG